eukprot:Gregarina_sp_Pseudo_9__5700@NODE_817_length_2169_cov_13_920188_g767_i0_p1_GENE_NODE_817_length_2169_cov_13_920188_g767_i0NODE_817_length_2169_cov_13_920188_g767_i0_p1_ORF_typecomplete_len699_score140_85Glycos_transf_2/PF00535_26/4_4e21Glyco_tranf_2_3/PF13641_6/2_3e18Glyco_transf_7C/PF02709_14/3_9e16Glyco_tranf_2_2/PF10111_9/2_2e03Glyco_tranf_2_2/PF10111_9/1e08Glyco_transf_21/PF13506_6/6e05Ricin_B_lectin/PF00652_22/7_5Ricin_B_lectin/PF00652_22/0_28CHGN/PF05679_16/0_077_NODE_817_length_2169_cov_13
MSALDLISRKVEEALPVADQTREKLNKEGSVKRWVSKGLVCLVVVWTVVVVLLAFRFLTHSTEEALRQDLQLVGGVAPPRDQFIKRPVPLHQLRRAEAGWKPSNPSADHLHGRDLGKLPNGQHHPWESSLQLPLDRVAEDHRPNECKAKTYDERLVPRTSVIIIFCNEPFETLMRSVHSVLNTAPPKHLAEIVLVDDGSDAAHILPREDGGSGELEDYLKLLPPKIRLIRMGRRAGIVGARLQGIREAVGEAFVILDSHVEAQPGWLESLVYPIGKDPKSLVMPHIDGLDLGTFAYKHGGVGCTLGIIWKVMEHAFDPDETSPKARREAGPADYVSSPTMAGGLFAANRDYFLSIGGYDEEMTGWGAENVELSFRLWQCGGQLLCTECSRLYHLFGGGKHYQTQGGSYNVNRMRTMAAWMDEYADISWHVLGRPPLSEVGNLTKMLGLRKEKQCKSFQWFLDEVWPESEVRQLPVDVPYTGPIKSAMDNYCLPIVSRGASQPKLTSCSEYRVGAFTFWSRQGRITTETNDETCWLGSNKFDWCHHRDTRGWQVNVIANQEDDKFVEVLGQDDLGAIGINPDPEKHDAPFDGRGKRALVQIVSSRGYCLTATQSKTGAWHTDFQKCDRNLPRHQLWTWSQRLQIPFWKQLHDEGNTTN